MILDNAMKLCDSTDGITIGGLSSGQFPNKISFDTQVKANEKPVMLYVKGEGVDKDIELSFKLDRLTKFIIGSEQINEGANICIPEMPNGTGSGYEYLWWASSDGSAVASGATLFAAFTEGLQDSYHEQQ